MPVWEVAAFYGLVCVPSLIVLCAIFYLGKRRYVLNALDDEDGD